MGESEPLVRQDIQFPANMLGNQSDPVLEAECQNGLRQFHQQAQPIRSLIENAGDGRGVFRHDHHGLFLEKVDEVVKRQENGFQFQSIGGVLHKLLRPDAFHLVEEQDPAPTPLRSISHQLECRKRCCHGYRVL